MQAEVLNPEVAQVEAQLVPVYKAEIVPLVESCELAVIDEASHKRASEEIVALRRTQRTVEELLAPVKKRLTEALDALRQLEKRFTDPIRLALSARAGAVAKYEEAARLEAERIRQQAQRAADEEAALATMFEDGDAVLAGAPPVMAPMVAVEPAVAKVDGLGWRETRSYEITNEDQLVAFCLTNPTYRHLVKVTVNKAALNALAKSLGGRITLPGARYVSVRVPVVTR